ncbi:hypothetical protein GCM10011409_27350 [Lentibacillus populi]|uniref:Uncharacterized protein n=1 Tax=Lentibacillus populi TaxID=1827502 RepID=A0A9W5TZ88_9BACI|nr:hypothetical protein [Lentibacillus populi]GGB48321.1 hypothetical protein GCM10011409_27350 [Lentibacillus populi]
MININTFIKIPNTQIDNLNEILENPTKYFVDIDNVKEIKKYKQNLDLDYLDGVITIKYYDQLIMDYSLWDLVDQLWSYFINLIEDVIQTGYGVTYFPDQPIKVEMKVVSKDLILFTVDEGRITSVTVPMQGFINALLSSAENFFNRLTSYFGKDINISYELNKVKSIRKQFN